MGLSTPTTEQMNAQWNTDARIECLHNGIRVKIFTGKDFRPIGWGMPDGPFATHGVYDIVKHGQAYQASLLITNERRQQCMRDEKVHFVIRPLRGGFVSLIGYMTPEVNARALDLAELPSSVFHPFEGYDLEKPKYKKHRIYYEVSGVDRALEILRALRTLPESYQDELFTITL